MGLLLLFVNAHAHRSKVFGHLHAGTGSTGNRREGQGIVLASACAQEMRKQVSLRRQAMNAKERQIQ